jgi:hypothetical protein
MSSRLLAAMRSTLLRQRRTHRLLNNLIQARPDRAQRLLVQTGATSTQQAHLQARAVDLLRQLVDGDVAGRAHKHGPLAQLHKVVHNGGRRDGLASAGRALDKAERPLQRRLDRVDLRLVKLGQARRREAGA